MDPTARSVTAPLILHPVSLLSQSGAGVESAAGKTKANLVQTQAKI